MNSNHGYQSLPLAFVCVKCAWLPFRYPQPLSLLTAPLQPESHCLTIYLLSKLHEPRMLVSSPWAEVADATLKQVHIINEAVKYGTVQCIPSRHTGRVRQEGGRLMLHTISFSGKISTPHLPKESLQCGSDYIAAFGLKCPKPLRVL